jgi:hypothetical protein
MQDSAYTCKASVVGRDIQRLTTSYVRFRTDGCARGAHTTISVIT